MNKLYVENRDLKEENKNLHSVKNELLTKCHKLKEQVKEANNLLLGFLDENICSFDHNGYCQEHSSAEPDYRCIQQQLKWYFKKYEVKND